MGNNVKIKEDTIYFSPGMSHVIEGKENIKDFGILVNENVKYTNIYRRQFKKQDRKLDG